jgi:hypothetical protein
LHAQQRDQRVLHVGGLLTQLVQLQATSRKQFIHLMIATTHGSMIRT